MHPLLCTFCNLQIVVNDALPLHGGSHMPCSSSCCCSCGILLRWTTSLISWGSLARARMGGSTRQQRKEGAFHWLHLLFVSIGCSRCCVHDGSRANARRQCSISSWMCSWVAPFNLDMLNLGCDQRPCNAACCLDGVLEQAVQALVSSSGNRPTLPFRHNSWSHSHSIARTLTVALRVLVSVAAGTRRCSTHSSA